MKWNKTNRFEESLQRVEQGGKPDQEFIPLIQASRSVSKLAEMPQPPQSLSAGRQKFLTEAARLRMEGNQKSTRLFWLTRRMGMVGALVSILLVIGLMLGVGYATADSLPGTPFYALKLAAEETLMGLTTKPQARADLAVTLAEERITEITTLMDTGEPVDEPVMGRAKEHLALAVAETTRSNQQAGPATLARLMTASQTQRRLVEARSEEWSESQRQAAQGLLRAMERARKELHMGNGEASGEQHRSHQGTSAQSTPSGPAEQPGPGPNPTEKPGPGPNPTEKPGPGPGPTDAPGGPGSPPTD